MNIYEQGLDRTAANHDLLGAEFELRWNWRLRQLGDQRAPGRKKPNWLGGRTVARGESIGIELACREHGMQQRRRTKPQLAKACELHRALLSAVAGLKLFKPCGRGVSLELR